MERYFTVVKRSESPSRSNKEKKCADDDDAMTSLINEATSSKFHPYRSSSVNKLLLTTLKNEGNPITTSDLVERSDQVFSASTGHQVAEGNQSRKVYHHERQAALANQYRPNTSGNSGASIFQGTRIYINGYLEGTTDIEVKRLVAEGGGKVLFTPSRSTHILTSRGLNGSKTHAYLKSSKGNRPYIVKPEWVLDSVACGRRRPERPYIVKMDQTLAQFMKIG